jgi:hypothetical protein
VSRALFVLFLDLSSSMAVKMRVTIKVMNINQATISMLR